MGIFQPVLVKQLLNVFAMTVLSVIISSLHINYFVLAVFMPAGIRVSRVGLTLPDWSRVRFQTKSDPWSSRLGVGRQANNLLP